MNIEERYISGIAKIESIPLLDTLVARINGENMYQHDGTTGTSCRYIKLGPPEMRETIDQQFIREVDISLQCPATITSDAFYGIALLAYTEYNRLLTIGADSGIGLNYVTQPHRIKEYRQTVNKFLNVI